MATRTRIKIYIVLMTLFSIENRSQNLLLNSSFSEVNTKKDSLKQYSILPENLSDVKSWYLPGYINYKPMTEEIKQLYGATDYRTNRDKNWLLKNKFYTDGEQLFENNLGFIRMYINNSIPVTIIQQKLSSNLKRGKYCLKFKYKFLASKSSYKGTAKLDFCLSGTNLQEYYKQNRISVPKHLIQEEFLDSLRYLDSNSPWQQKCFNFTLDGGEQFLSIGTLNIDKYNHSWAEYFIDDVELYADTEKECFCEQINKDLSLLYNKSFPLDREISSDTLIMFTPRNNWTPGIITPVTKQYLNEVISFMQRNPGIKITLIEHNQYNNLNRKPIYCDPFKNYLLFFGIDRNAIYTKVDLCKDSREQYCGFKSEYVKIGFKLNLN